MAGQSIITRKKRGLIAARASRQWLKGSSSGTTSGPATRFGLNSVMPTARPSPAAGSAPPGGGGVGGAGGGGGGGRGGGGFPPPRPGGAQAGPPAPTHPRAGQGPPPPR